MKPKVTPDKASYNKGEISLPVNKGLDQRTNPQMAATGYAYAMDNVDPLPDGSVRVRSSFIWTGLGDSTYVLQKLVERYGVFTPAFTHTMTATVCVGDWLVSRYVAPDNATYFVQQSVSDPSQVFLCFPYNVSNTDKLNAAVRYRLQEYIPNDPGGATTTTYWYDTYADTYGLARVIDGNKAVFWSRDSRNPAIVVDVREKRLRRLGTRGVPWAKPNEGWGGSFTDLAKYVFGIEFVIRGSDGGIIASSSVIRSCAGGKYVVGGGGTTWQLDYANGAVTIALSEFVIGKEQATAVGPRIKPVRAESFDRLGVKSAATAGDLWQEDAWTHVRIWRSKRTNRLDSSPDIEPRGDANTLYLIAEYAYNNGIPYDAGSLDSDGTAYISGLDLISGATKTIKFLHADLELEDRSLPIASDKFSPTIAKASVSCDMVRPPALKAVTPFKGRLAYAPHSTPSPLDYSKPLGDDDTVYATSANGRMYNELFQISFVKVGAMDGGGITALASNADGLYIAKQYSTYLVLDNDIASQPARVVSTQTGVLDQNHFLEHDIGILTLCTDGRFGVTRSNGFYTETGGVDYSLGLPQGEPTVLQKLHSGYGRISLTDFNNYAKSLTTKFDHKVGWSYYAPGFFHHTQIPGDNEQLFIGDHAYKMVERNYDEVTNGTDYLYQVGNTLIPWTFAPYGINGAQEEIVELRHASTEASWPTLAEVTTLDADLLTSNGALDKDQSPAGQTPKQQGTVWELSCSGYSDLLADPSRVPTASKHSYWNYIYYPGTQTTTEWTRTRVYANALVLRFVGTGQMHAKNCKASVVVMHNPGGLESYRRQQVDWNNLTQYNGDISNLGIHDLETEPYTWS